MSNRKPHTFSKEEMAKYNVSRDPEYRHLSCHAPWRSLYFGIQGSISMCCYNQKDLLGYYGQGQSILDLWRGEKAQSIRREFSNRQMAKGCSRCAQLIKQNNVEGLLAKKYDSANSPVPSSWIPKWYAKGNLKPDYPEVLEFETGNRCNLACVMCNEACSSTIRSNMGLPPMKEAYNDSFIQEIKTLLPHIKSAHFFGGEPFLIRHYLEIWEAIISINPRIVSHVSTNGTILNGRVRSIITGHPMNLSISMDAFTKKVYEKIRINGDYEALRKNIDYFLSIKEELDDLSITACVMPINAMDIIHLVSFCQEHRINVFFNTVFEPREHSLRSMKKDDLAKVLHHYEDYQKVLEHEDAGLSINKRRFNGLIEQIRILLKEEDDAKHVQAPLSDKEVFRAWKQTLSTRSAEIQAVTSPSVAKEAKVALQTIYDALPSHSLKKTFNDEIGRAPVKTLITRLTEDDWKTLHHEFVARFDEK